MLRSRTLALVALAVLLVLFDVVYVPRGEVAVREAFGGRAVALRSGLHLRVPLYHRLYRYDTRPMKLDEPIEIVTKDSAGFKLPVRMTAWISAEDLLTFHRGRAGRDPSAYMRDQLSGAVREAARGLNADEILTSDPTRRLAPAISAGLIAAGIAAEDFSIERPAAQVVFNAVLDDLRRRFPASARRLAESALALDPRESLYHAALGAVLESEGKREAAEKAYQDALFLDPSSPEPMSRLFVMYQASNDAASIARLERLLVASLQKNPRSPVHHDWLGQVYMREKRLADAEMSFQTAIGEAPSEPQFRISLGGLRVQQGKIDEARAAFEEALKIRPDHPLALFDIGATYAMQNQFDKAIEYFQRAERAGPPNHALFNALAQAFEEKGRFDRAVEYLRRSLQIKPDQPDRQSELKRDEQQLKKKG